MHKYIVKILSIMVIGLLVACTSTNPYKPLTDSETKQFTVIEPIQISFTADNGIGSSIITESVKQYAYIQLKEEASKKHRGNIDIRNITVVYVKGVYPNQEWLASGDIVTPNSMAGVEESLAKAAEQIMASIQSNANIAIVYVSSNDFDIADFITGELEYIMVNGGFTIVDRSHLDKIRQEQDFQLSGEVDDDTAVSIGKITGASIIITGSVTGTDSSRRLRLRALSVQTAQVLAVASERL
jgi:hypothetical protein